MGQDMVVRAAKSDKILAFSFGVFFILFILAVAIFNPSPSDFSYTIFRIVLALAAAGIGAVIPGFINVRVGPWIRAGGAMALFAIVYFFPVAGLTLAEGAQSPPEGSAKPAAEQWLKQLDVGNYSAAYKFMSDSVASQYPESEVVELIRKERAALGSIQVREFNASSSAVNPPGLAKGFYRSYGFKSYYKNYKEPIFDQINLHWEEGQWKVAGFFTYVKNESGNFVPFSVELKQNDSGK